MLAGSICLCAVEHILPSTHAANSLLDLHQDCRVEFSTLFFKEPLRMAGGVLRIVVLHKPMPSQIYVTDERDQVFIKYACM